MTTQSPMLNQTQLADDVFSAALSQQPPVLAQVLHQVRSQCSLSETVAIVNLIHHRLHTMGALEARDLLSKTQSSLK